jgi:hypothetical protein
LRQRARVSAAELQRDGMLERIKADELVTISMQHGGGHDHLGIEGERRVMRRWNNWQCRSVHSING